MLLRLSVAVETVILRECCAAFTCIRLQNAFTALYVLCRFRVGFSGKAGAMCLLHLTWNRAMRHVTSVPAAMDLVSWRPLTVCPHMLSGSSSSTFASGPRWQKGCRGNQVSVAWNKAGRGLRGATSAGVCCPAASFARQRPIIDCLPDHFSQK